MTEVYPASVGAPVGVSKIFDPQQGLRLCVFVESSSRAQIDAVVPVTAYFGTVAAHVEATREELNYYDLTSLIVWFLVESHDIVYYQGLVSRNRTFLLTNALSTLHF